MSESLEPKSQKPKVYCKDCRFLRQSIKQEESLWPLIFCAAPRNLIKSYNFMTWGLWHKLPPETKNHHNNCPDFETVEQAISQKLEF